MTIRFSAIGTPAALTMPAAFQTLGNDLVSVTTTAETNTGRMLFRNFAVVLGAQGTNRDASAQVSLLLVPVVGVRDGDFASLKTAKNYIAYDRNGKVMTYDLDEATTGRILTFTNVCIPSGSYYVGVTNETGQAFAGANVLEAGDSFSVENSA